MTVGNLVSAYHRYGWSVGKRDATQQIHKYALAHFEEFAGADRLVNEIDAQLLDDYRYSLVQKGLKTVSVNSYLRSLRALFRWANRSGRATVDYQFPTIEFMRRGPITPKEVVNQEEFGMLLEATNRESTTLLQVRARAILMILYDTGLRASELCGAQWGDLEHSIIDGQASHTLRIQSAKGGDPRILPLHPNTWATIREYRAELLRPHGRGYRKRGNDPTWLFVSNRDMSEPLTVSGLRRLCERLGRHCQIHANPHKFRHSFASSWINQTEGQEIETLIEIAGWKDRKMLEVYGHYQTPSLVRAARRNSPINNLTGFKKSSNTLPDLLAEDGIQDPKERKAQEVLRRFKYKYHADVESGCWVWIGGVSLKYKQPLFMVERHMIRAARWIYEHDIGPIPPSYVVWQTCQNRLCVNPAHLVAGSVAELQALRRTALSVE